MGHSSAFHLEVIRRVVVLKDNVRQDGREKARRHVGIKSRMRFERQVALGQCGSHVAMAPLMGRFGLPFRVCFLFSPLFIHDIAIGQLLSSSPCPPHPFLRTKSLVQYTSLCCLILRTVKLPLCPLILRTKCLESRNRFARLLIKSSWLPHCSIATTFSSAALTPHTTRFRRADVCELAALPSAKPPPPPESPSALCCPSSTDRKLLEIQKR